MSKLNSKNKLTVANLVVLLILLMNIGFTAFVMFNSNQQIKDLKLEAKRANALSYKRLNNIERKLGISNPTAEELDQINGK